MYTGNVHDMEGGTTHCSNCGSSIIVRDWYVLKEWNLTDNGHCGNVIANDVQGPLPVLQVTGEPNACLLDCHL